MSGGKHKKIKLDNTTITTEQNQSHGSQEISRTTSSTLHVHKRENKTISNSSKMVAKLTNSQIFLNVKDNVLSRELSLSDRKQESFKSEKLCNQDYLSQTEPIGFLFTANINDKTTPQADQMSLPALIESGPQEQVLQHLQGDHSFSQYELDNALMAACRRGHKFFVQKLLRLGANVQYKDTNGNTPLMVCAENGFIHIVRFLLKRKADANAVNDAGDTALILSICTSGSTDMVKVLLEQSEINIHHQNHNGYTAFTKAVEAMDIETIEILLRNLNNQCSNDDLLVSNSSKLILDNVDEKSRTISEKLGIKNLLDFLINHEKHGPESRLTQAFELLDEESFNILVDSHLSTSNYADWLFEDVFKKIFDTKDLKHFDIKEISMIKSLLENGTSAKWNSLRDYVTAAVEAGNYPLLELLCQHMLQKSWCIKGYGPLHAAASKGQDDVILLFLSYGAEVNQDSFLSSPLDSAIKQGHINCAKLLIEHGAKLDIKKALFSAVDQKTAEYMNFLQQNCKHEILNYLKENKPSLQRFLISAARGGNITIIGQILDYGADINQPIDTGETALVESKNGEVAQFLIQRGADINQMVKDSKGWPNSPLVHVLKSRHSYKSEVVEIVRVLLQNGALVNGKDKHGHTSLMLAALEEGSETLLKILLDHGADVNIQNTKGNTVLHIVIETGPTADVLRYLLRFITAGSDVNCQNNDGFSPLMLASKHMLNSRVLILLDSGADVNALNKNDPRKTALSYCTDSTYCTVMFSFTEDIECLVSLLARGACASYADPSALVKIIKNGYTYLIPKLIQCGLGPADVPSVITSYKNPTVSPLSLSLLKNNVALARYFFGNMFLTKTDVPSLMGETKLRDFLESRQYQECLDFLNEFTSQPLSLFKLAFVSVSFAVGTSPERENRVNMLPLPQMIKDKLLFKSEEVPMVYEPSMQSPVYDSSDDLDLIIGSSDDSDSYYGSFSSDEDNYDTN